jgi:hypothetical protein
MSAAELQAARRICFVCQRGPLEAKAVLLAASLRRLFPSDIEIIAAHPVVHGSLRDETLRTLKELDVTTAKIENRLDAAYLIGNKLSAMALLAGEGMGLLLDTDIVAMAAPKLVPVSLGAVPATHQTCDLKTWQHLYKTFSVEIPTDVPATLDLQPTSAPYFNSGVIAVPGAIAENLAHYWIETSLTIDRDPLVSRRYKRPYLDQIAFPLAAARMGISIQALAPEWNFPSWVWRLSDRTTPILFHYQKLRRLTREDDTVALACETLRQSPDIARAFHSLAAPHLSLRWLSILAAPIDPAEMSKRDLERLLHRARF